MQLPLKAHESPLYAVLGTIAALWTLANVGYYAVLPSFGVELSYNTNPIAIAVYFLGWAAISIIYFWNHFGRWLEKPTTIWYYCGVSAVTAEVLWGFLYVLSLLPALNGPALVPYSDILFATPWYFLPKSAEVLMQQVLITILVLELEYRLHTLRRVLVAYALSFGGAHIVLFALSGAPTPYAFIITLSAILSSLVFPYLILKVRGGFVYAFTVHLLFYILLALFLHTWPPPGYYGL